MACFDKIIKLSRTTCECFDDNKPTDYDEGQSEVYVDELEGMNLTGLQGAENCEEGNIWDIMVKARANAELQLKADLLSYISDSYSPRRPNYSGLLGQVQFTQTLNYTDAIAGQKVFGFGSIVGGYMKIKRIGLMMSTTSSVTVKVYNNDQNQTTAIAQYTINSSANALAFATLSTPLELPLWSSNGVLLEYYFVYDLIGTYYPKNNKADCGCGGSQNRVTFKNWVRVAGIKGSAIGSTTDTEELNGIVLDAEFNCDQSRLICSDEYPLNFTNNGIAMQMAYAARFKTGALIIDEILSTPNINRYTMMDREALYGKRNFYRKSYQDYIPYLGGKLEVQNNDCLMCSPSDQMMKGKILV